MISIKIGGYIIADNVLWSGNVIKPAGQRDDETENLITFNEKVNNDHRVRNVLFPIRDGLMICERVS